VHRLAVSRHKNGNTAEAVPALEKSLRMHEQNCGPESPQMAALLLEIGCIYRDQGDYDRAKECLGRCLSIQEKRFGLDSPEALSVMQQLAGCYEDSGDQNGAAEQYERCLMLKLRSLGVEDVQEVALMQYSLANLHTGWGNLPRARELMMECIAAFSRDGGARLAVTHEMLAQIEQRSGRFHAALKELEQAGAVWEHCGPSNYAELIVNLNGRADILDQLRKTKEANFLRETAASLDASHTVHAQSA
jgi:tetratricopeptide (TPR) repeat protein